MVCIVPIPALLVHLVEVPVSVIGAAFRPAAVVYVLHDYHACVTKSKRMDFKIIIELATRLISVNELLPSLIVLLCIDCFKFQNVSRFLRGNWIQHNAPTVCIVNANFVFQFMFQKCQQIGVTEFGVWNIAISLTMKLIIDVIGFHPIWFEI